ncbi:MAG TPA: peptidase, partial [Burkholderiaceae bacterium]
MDSSLKSNLSVGLPLDLMVYEANTLASNRIICIDEQNPYFQMIRGTWGQRLRQVFESIEDPQWGEGSSAVPLRVAGRYESMKKITHPGERII